MPDLESSQRPNVVVLVSHDTGRHVSPYGVDTVSTPAFERLARESVCFKNAFSVAPHGSPARASLFSGRYPHSLGVMGNVGPESGWRFPSEDRHAARLFADEGYQSWLIGPCRETDRPETLGFDEIDFEPGVCAATDCLRHRVSKRDRTRPFYCQINCHETHRPFDWDDTPPDAGAGIFLPGYLHPGPETRKDLAAFQGSVRRLDEGLGALTEFLDDYDLADNTILAVTTDHGIAFPRAKCTLHGSGLGVMLFLRYPRGEWRGGTVRSELVSHVDLVPTLLEACWIDPPADREGHSFFPLLFGSSKGARDAVFAEKTFSSFYAPARAIRTAQYSYVRHFEWIRQTELPPDVVASGAAREWLVHDVAGSPTEELYDLGADPDELNNLAHEPGWEEQRATLSLRLAAWMEETADPLCLGPISSPFFRKSRETFFPEG